MIWYPVLLFLQELFSLWNFSTSRIQINGYNFKHCCKSFFETIKSRAFKDQRFEYFFFFLHFFRFGDHIWHTRKLNHWSCKSKGIFSKFNFLVKFKQNWKLRSARDIEYNWNILICTLWYDEEIKFKIKCGGFLLVGYLRAYFITLATSKARVDHNDQYETQLSLQKGIVPK